MHPAIPAHDQAAAKALIHAILANPGHTVSVFDSECWVVKKSRDVDAIIAAMGETDVDSIRVRDGGNTIIGTFWLMYGNGHGETVSNWTDNEYCNGLMEHFN